MNEKLDSLSKILLATGTINYMASSIYSMNEQIRQIPNIEDIHKEDIGQRDEVLAEAVSDLAKVLNKLGNLLNAQDAVSAIDLYVTTPSFMVVVNGHDDVEGDFDNID